MPNRRRGPPNRRAQPNQPADLSTGEVAGSLGVTGRRSKVPLVVTSLDSPLNLTLTRSVVDVKAAVDPNGDPATTDGVQPEADEPERTADVPTDQVFEMYKVAHEMQRYDGDGIWSRFNILFTLNSVLLATATVAERFPGFLSGAVLITLCAAGAIISLWALYVLRRLWKWHDHQKQVLEDLEALLPKDLPKLISNRPENLRGRPKWLPPMLDDHTQPFMLVMAALWLALLVDVATRK